MWKTSMGTGKYKDEIVFLNNLKTSGYTYKMYK